MSKSVIAALLIILIIFLAQAIRLNFIQDDAFISYRYVKNLASGQGLVFNSRERIEGYTNFFWIVLLSLSAAFGVNIILASKILGLAAGCGALVLLYQISSILLSRQITMRESLQREEFPHLSFLPLIPPLLMATNGAFAYWSISGLESSLFVFSVLLSTYFYLTRERLVVLSCALCSLIRPEGVLIFAILVVHKLLFQKDTLKACSMYIAGFVLLLLPYLLFKIWYYGDLLPNPFYAKTGLSWEYLASGLSYFWHFLQHYGLWGLLYILPPALWRRLSRAGKLACLMIWIYTLYIVVVGGDVLQGHRFFLPIIPFLYILLVVAMLQLSLLFKNRLMKGFLWAMMILILTLLTFLLPRQWLQAVRRAEIGLSLKMTEHAMVLKNVFDKRFTVATSTIGAISYYSGATVIDMLGLTDRYIARHPETIPGIVSPWKERRYNTRYLLSREPDVILFSTGMKPSASAEKALFMNSQFRLDYYPYYIPRGKILWVIFRHKEGEASENRVFPDAQFVNLFNEAMNLELKGNYKGATAAMQEVFRLGPQDFAWAYDQMASLQFLLGNRDEAKRFARRAVELDEYCLLSHFVLHEISLSEGDSIAAQREELILLQYNPELLQISRKGNTGS